MTTHSLFLIAIQRSQPAKAAQAPREDAQLCTVTEGKPSTCSTCSTCSILLLQQAPLLRALKDAQLLPPDLCAFMRALGVRLRPRELAAMFEMFDADGSGSIDGAEFLSLFFKVGLHLHECYTTLIHIRYQHTCKNVRECGST
jgi:EF hand